ncbi:MAG: hypothetical protein WCO44_02200 [Bacteroidota bacterium]
MTWFKLCLFFLGGFLAGFILFRLLGKGNEDPAIHLPDKQELSAGVPLHDSLTVADLLRYDTPLAKATIKVLYSPKVAEIRIDLSSLYPVKSLVEFDVNSLSLLNLQHTSVNDQSTSMTSANFVQFNSVGDNKYIILLSNKNALPHKVDFTISQNDVTIYHNSVEINK